MEVQPTSSQMLEPWQFTPHKASVIKELTGRDTGTCLKVRQVAAVRPCQTLPTRPVDTVARPAIGLSRRST